jgi:hypothetical protein
MVWSHQWTAFGLNVLSKTSSTIRRPRPPTYQDRRLSGADRRWPFTHGVFCAFSSWRFISFEAPLVAGASLLPLPKYAFAGPGGVLPLLASLLAPPGPPLPELDMPVPPPPAANAKLGIKTSATVTKDLRVIGFLQIVETLVERYRRYAPEEEMLLNPAARGM